METLQRTANRGSISTGPYQIDNSLKFERDNNEAVETTNQAAGNRKTWTFSAWIKRTALSEDYHTIFGAGYTNIQIMSNNRPRLVLYDGTSYYADPEMLLRDTSAWYHIVVQLDTTQSTASDRVKWWINGDRVTAFDNTTYTNMSQNDEFEIGQAGAAGSGAWLRLGRFFSGDEGFDGYMADVYYLNGTAEDADAFGEYDEDSGIWIPKAYTGSGYGTQGFHYKFDNAASIGEDSSGEGHDANSFSNITSADQATDTPTNNFATMSPLWKYATSSTLTNGGTYISTSTAGWTGAKGSIGVQNGKWYWEVKTTNVGWSLFPAGIQTDGEDNINSGNAHSQNTTMALGTGSTYIKYVSGSEASVSTGGVSMTTNNITGVALDLDSATKTLKWFRNNTLVATIDIASVSASFGNQLVFPFSSIYADSGTVFIEYNYGGYTTFSISSAESDENGYGTFEYAPPTGYYALCTKNLAEYG